MNNKPTFASKYIAFVIAVTPVVGIYLLTKGLNFAVALQIPAILLGINNWRTSVYEAKNERFLFIGVLIISFISLLLNAGQSWYSTTLFTHNLFALGVSFLFLIIAVPQANISTFIKTTMLLGLIASAVALYQRLQLMLSGSFTHINLFPGLTQTVELELDYLRRPTSIFSEPSHTSIYLLPIFYYLLSRKRYVVSAFVAVAILATGSSTGFVLIPILIFINLIASEASTKSKVWFAVLSVAAFVAITVYAPYLISDNIEKVQELDGTEGRLFRGLVVINQMSGLDSIFGLGLNQMEAFMGQGFTNYANSLLYMIISYGFVGFIVLIAYLIKAYKKNVKMVGFFAIMFLVICTDQILFNRNFVYLDSFVILSLMIRTYIEEIGSKQPRKNKRFILS